MLKFSWAARRTFSCTLTGIRMQHQNTSPTLGEGFKEIEIPVPWGHIAGKWWGNTDAKPILGLHGWQDNAGTWDRLAPMLPDHVSFLAIDYPGHGMSSRFPSGIPYRLTDHIFVIKHILRNFGWNKFSLLAHSMGGVQSFIYASIYPDEVENLICIDSFKPLSVNPDTDIKRMAEDIDKFLEVERQEETLRPLYTYDELVKKLFQKMEKFGVTEESCKILLKRAVEKSGNGYYFRTDPRWKVTRLGGWLHETILLMASGVTCKFLFIKADPGFSYEKPEITRETLEVIKKSAKKYEYHVVDGYHHVHLDHPERVAPIIANFCTP